MLHSLRDFAQFISVERGLMLFMISVGATFLTIGSIALPQAFYLGLIVFFGWSALDALNNIFDADLDVISDPSRSEYTKKLGKTGLVIVLAFSALASGLGAATMTPLVVMFTIIGIFFGILYSVPPLRLRQTVYKPLVNFTVGAMPVLIVASFSHIFSVSVLALVFLIGVTTAVNSLWEDLADYGSDSANAARTVPIILGLKKGLFFTIVLGYSLIPLMILAGILFQLPLIYYVILSAATTFVSLHLYQNRIILFRKGEIDTMGLLRLGGVLAKDFVIVAIVQTGNLMLSSIVKLC
jgi:4-hydroxybenzoate polyprenyltransferase